MSRFTYDNLDAALAALAAPLSPVGRENDNAALLGRVLAGTLVSDRDSPAANVSAMDGYAVAGRDARSAAADLPPDLQLDGEITVTAESVPGSPPAEFESGGVIRIFTGAMIPPQCDRVIQREQTIESRGDSSNPLGTIRWRDAARRSGPGENIRRRGENLAAGEPVLLPGLVIRAPQLAAMANFGIDEAPVYRKVNVAVVTTGDELSDVHPPGVDTLPPWKIRNSNAHALRSLLASRPFIAPPTMKHAPDDPESLRTILADALDTHDLVVLTGGVSMGDHDYVPRVVDELGAKTIFHKLPLRPGKPILGAIHQPDSSRVAKAIVGLPGNPVSATMGALRFVIPLIDKLAGISRWQPTPPSVTLDSLGDKTLPLYWLRAVRLTGPGRAELVIGKGSGDLVSLAQSDGFIEMPPNAHHTGPWPFFAW